MPWVRLDDNLGDHPKMVIAGPLAFALHVKALLYCGRYLTDGLVPRGIVPTLIDWEHEGVFVRVSEGEFSDAFDVPRNFELADRLVEVGAWVKADNGYLIHDYLEYQNSRDHVLAERHAAKERMTKARAAKGCSEDVRANIVRSSGNPIPIPIPKTEQKKTEETNAAPPLESFDFDAVYALYPRKEGKAGGLRRWKREITTKAKYDAWKLAVKNYAAHVAGRSMEHVKQFDSFMSCWEEYVDFTPRPAETRVPGKTWQGKQIGIAEVERPLTTRVGGKL